MNKATSDDVIKIFDIENPMGIDRQGTATELHGEMPEPEGFGISSFFCQKILHN